MDGLSDKAFVLPYTHATKRSRAHAGRSWSGETRRTKDGAVNAKCLRDNDQYGSASQCRPMHEMSLVREVMEQGSEDRRTGKDRGDELNILWFTILFSKSLSSLN